MIVSSWRGFRCGDAGKTKEVGSGMRRFVQVCGVLGMAVALAASATAPAKHDVNTTIAVETSFDATWEAVIDSFADHQWAIKTVDKASGLISTEPMAAEENFADCGASGIASVVGPTTVTFNVRVKSEEKGASVAVNTTFRQEREADHRRFFALCTSQGVAEKIIQDEVKSRSGSIAARRDKATKSAQAEKRFYCTSAPADVSLGFCFRSQAVCTKREQDVIAAAGDATPCAPQPTAVCFKGVNAEGVTVESCHPSAEACTKQHDKADLRELTSCE